MSIATATFAPASGQTVPTTSRSSRHFKIVLLGTALAALLGGATAYGHHYWTIGRFLESTDDAYVKADSTTVAPKVSGHLVEVLVADNQQVRAGDILARIDDRDSRTSLDAARADLATATTVISNIDAQVDLQKIVVEQQDAAIAGALATFSFAQLDAERYQALAKTGAGTVQRAQQTEAALANASAQLRRDRAAKLAAEQTIRVLGTEREKARAQRERAAVAVAQAQLNLSYATIMAPVDGTVGARTLRVGQYVTAGTQLMAVVPVDLAYIVANFKETQLARVRPGQPVSIAVDGQSGRTWKGHVDSLSPASGLEFALLPPDNATGNFTKIVQRIPVRIVFDDVASGTLRAGMSVEPTIDTREAETPANGRERSAKAALLNTPLLAN